MYDEKHIFIGENMTVSTIIRTICLVVALINQCLVSKGISTLPFLDEDIEQIVTLAITTVTALIAWWKNNSVTLNAIQADKYLDKLNGV